MTLAELISAFRSTTSDTALPYLWSDAEVTMYLNAAEIEAATRANLLQVTGGTYGMITTVPETSEYTVSPLVLEIKRIKIGEVILSRKTKEALDDEWPGWEIATGSPTRYILTGQTLRAVPIPEAAENMIMDVVRLPITMASTGPEIPAKYHLKLMDWVFFLAYSKQDADTFNADMANMYSRRFDQSFGESQTANVQRQQLTQMPTQNRPTWI